MAQRSITILIDDITGKELADGNGETIHFSLDGVRYQLDLDNRSAEKLRAIFAPYIRAGRRLTNTGRTTRRIKTSADPVAVRAWASSHGIKVSDRGRIPASVLDQFRAAGN